MRKNGRSRNSLRSIKIIRDFTAYAEGSVLIECGQTKVLCTATVEDKVPRFLKGQNQGWVTAEYSLLPRATQTRNNREAARGKQSGRTIEIQRLIGRALRSVVDLEALGEKTITLDCDVLQADGGTRTAAITGAFVAMTDAVFRTLDKESAKKFPINDYCAAISVGMDNEGPILDLDYEEDSSAIVDMNIVRTGKGNLVEVQGTGEQGTFNREEMNALLDLGEKGTNELFTAQKMALGVVAKEIGAIYEEDSISNEE